MVRGPLWDRARVGKRVSPPPRPPACLPQPPGPPPASRRECPPPTLFLPQRALPGPHFWDNSALLLLAPCQHPPALWSGAGCLHPVSSAVAGAEGRQLGGLGPLPLPRAHTHHQPRPTQGAGRCSRVPSPGWGPPAPIATSQMAGAAPQGIFRQGGGSGVEGAGRKGGAVGLVLSWKRNLENVALLRRL